MSGFAVVVDFRIKPGTAEPFHRTVSENARLSLEREPGCRQFDVVLPEGEPDRVFLYEIYDDEAAFEAHKATPHFLQFDRESAGLVAAKAVFVGRRHFPNRTA